MAFQLTRKADYGLIALTHILRVAPEVVNAADIARTYGMSASLLANVLKALKREGILDSMRGMNGGYVALRKASEITVRDVIQILDENTFAKCAKGISEDSPACGLGNSCPIKKPVLMIHERIDELLGSVPFTELIAAMDPLWTEAETQKTSVQ